MGGFLYIKKSVNSHRESRIDSSITLNVFYKKKMKLIKYFENKSFEIFVFKKKFSDIPNYYEFENGDFIVVSGTFIYSGKTGIEGLKQIYLDYKSKDDFLNRIRGNYCVLIYLNKELFIFRDFFGYYPVYTSGDFSVISSSYLALCTLIEDLSISHQEFFEYLFNGYFYSEKTIFKEINILNEGMIIKIIPDVQKKKWKNKASDYELSDDFDIAVEDVSADLLRYFEEISNAFPDRIRTAISGGYDTRLMLACLLRLGIHPQVYVNGTPNSKDIQCAEEISKGENLPLEIIHFYKWFDEIKNNYEEKIEERFFFFDGLGAGGIFDNYSDYEYRVNNPVINSLILNGAGGEIYRESWNLPNRNFSMNSYIQARYNKFDFSFCKSDFHKKEYFEVLKEKIYISMEKKSKKITRQEVEYLHPLRYKAAHFVFTILQQLNHFLMPFLEPKFIYKSYNIPLQWKLNGKFHVALMKNIYPELTKYQSTYGYDFNSSVPLKYWVKMTLERNIPLTWRPLLRKIRKSKKLPVQKYGFSLLSPKYLERIFDLNDLFIDRYIDVSLIKDQTILSRALSLEKLLKNCMR